MKSPMFFIISLVIFATTLGAKDYYYSDYESVSDVHFISCGDPAVIKNIKKAISSGYFSNYTSNPTEQNDGRNHGGVMSHKFKFNLSNTNYAIWGGKPFSVPAGAPVYFSAFVLPESVSPDVRISFKIRAIGVARNTKKTKIQDITIKSSGKDMEGWMCFSHDLTGVLNESFSGKVLLSWELCVFKKQKFNGEEICIYLDDIRFSEHMQPLQLINSNTEATLDIDAKGNPYVVNYRSFYKEFPRNSVNKIFNSSFETGLGYWHKLAFIPDSVALKNESVNPPKKSQVFVTSNDAAYGKHSLRVKHDGQSLRTIIIPFSIDIHEGHNYTLSFSAKSSENTVINVQGKKIALNNKWGRYSIPLNKIECFKRWNGKKYPGRMKFRISHTGSEDLWFDAFQLAEKNVVEYQEPELLEFSIVPDSEYGIFAPTEPVSFTARFYNGTKNKKKSVFHYTIKNFCDKIVEENEQTLILNPGQNLELKLKGPQGLRHYRITAMLKTSNQPVQTTTSTACVAEDLSGITGNEFFGGLDCGVWNSPNHGDVLELSKRSGFKFLNNYNTAFFSRTKDGWRKHNRQWEQLKYTVRQNKRYGLETVPNIDPIPYYAKLDSDHVPIITEKEKKGIYDYCKTLAEKFKDDIKRYDVFIEFIRTPVKKRAKVISDVLPDAFRGLKAGNPASIISAPSEVPARNREMLRELEEVFRNGSLAYLDEVSIHPYTQPYSPEEMQLYLQIGELRELMKKYNHGKVCGIFASESGFRGLDTLYYDLIDGESMTYSLCMTELQQAEYNARLIAILFGEQVKYNATFITLGGFGDNDVNAWAYFRNENGICPKTTYSALIQMTRRLAGAKAVKRIEYPQNDILGYVFVKNNKAFAILWSYNPNRNTCRGKFSRHIPGTLENMVGEQINWNGQELPLGPAPIFLMPQNISNADFIEQIESMKFPNVKISLKKISDSNMIVTLTNQSQNEFHGIMSVLGKQMEVTLGKREQKDFVLPMLRLPSGPLDMKISIAGKSANFSKQYKLLLCRNTSKSATESYVLDAKNRYSRVNGSVYGGATDCQARISTWYDANFLHISAEVTDNIRAIPFQKIRIWENDSIQFAFNMDDATSQEQRIEFVISDTPKGIQSYLYAGNADLKAIKSNVEVIDGKTVYHISIPWFALKKGFKPDNKTLPAFNIAINDNDDPTGKTGGFKQTLQLTSGIYDTKESRYCRKLFFVEP